MENQNQMVRKSKDGLLLLRGKEAVSIIGLGSMGAAGYREKIASLITALRGGAF